MARNDHFQTKAGTEIVKELDAIAATEGPRSSVFSDFLDISIACLAGETLEPLYLQAIKRYAATDRKESHLKRLCHAFKLLMTADEPDVLGDVFEGGITWGENGQFFTPLPVCEMLCRMNGLDQPDAGRAIHDPCCGSGRMLIAAAKVSGPLAASRVFSGIDVDQRCAKMTAINLALNGVTGWVVHGNSLTLETRNAWIVSPFHGENFPGMIRQEDPANLTKYQPHPHAPPKNAVEADRAAVGLPPVTTPPRKETRQNGQQSLFSAFEGDQA